MCNCKSDDEIEVCAVAAGDIACTAEGVEGVVLMTIPETGDVRVTNTIPSQREAFKAASTTRSPPTTSPRAKRFPTRVRTLPALLDSKSEVG